MNSISQILPLSNIAADFDASDKAIVFDHIGQLFAEQQGLSHKQIVDALVQREKLGSTALGQGIAIPHGRIKGLKQALGAFVRLKHPVSFDAPDGKQVGLIFIMLVPEQANESHLRLLSELAQMFSDRTLREALASAPDAEQIHLLFCDWTPS